MILLCEKFVILFLTGFLFITYEYGLLIKGKTNVTANGNTIISGPFLQIEKPTVVRLIIKKPRLPHFLSCFATIDEAFYYQNETEYYHTWYRNDNELDSFSGRRNDFIIYQNGTLRLPPNEKAGGVYRCQINANKTAVLSESITVVYPVLKRLPTTTANISAINGQSLTIDCPVLSAPPANVSWYFTNISLSNNSNNNRFIFLANGSLVLRRVTFKDSGKYSCVAQNQFALRTHRQFSWTLTVNQTDVGFESKNINSNAARLIPNLQNETIYIPKGGDAVLYCHSMGGFVPIIWWFKRSANETLTRISNHSSEYHIQNASLEYDQGYYICKTSNDQQTFRIIVTVPPTIAKPLPSYETLITASLTFTCRSQGNPPPSISWYHNGALLNSSYTRYINGNELVIHSFDPDEDGMYQCFARNIAGETYSTAEVRFRNKGGSNLRRNPLKNIRCYAHSFNTINITFDSKSAESLFIVHIVQEHPHRWTSPFAPMKLNHTSHVIISSYLPIYRPFELITRVLFPTSEIRSSNKPQQQTVLSSLRSKPVTCCTQGLLLHLVTLGHNSTFLTWSQPELNVKKYFVLQFSVDETQPHPRQLREQTLHGTTKHVELKAKDIEQKLEKIVSFNESLTQQVLSRAESRYSDVAAVAARQSEPNEEIFNLLVPSNVSGILLQNFTRIKIRVLIITTENENLAQDFRYVQWKIIENGTTELSNTPFHLTTVESRMLGFSFQDIFNESCVDICHWQIQFPIINKEQPKCKQQAITNSQIEVRGLKPLERYRLNFFSCESHILYGQLDAKTLPDPPGTISNQRIVRDRGLKLKWDPPLQPNGKIYHYNILWTLGNVTHEVNILECTPCLYKFPNVSETSKINVTVRVVGETGVGAPIFIDLRTINHQTLERERNSSNTDIYNGIAIGTLLSVLCVACFAVFIILQRRRFKQRQQPPVHLVPRFDVTFSNLQNTGLPSEIAGSGISGGALHQECYEMQTLIPKSGCRVKLFAESSNLCENKQWPILNGKLPNQDSKSSGPTNETNENEATTLSRVHNYEITQSDRDNSCSNLTDTHFLQYTPDESADIPNTFNIMQQSTVMPPYATNPIQSSKRTTSNGAEVVASTSSPQLPTPPPTLPHKQSSLDTNTSNFKHKKNIKKPPTTLSLVAAAFHPAGGGNVKRRNGNFNGSTRVTRTRALHKYILFSKEATIRSDSYE